MSDVTELPELPLGWCWTTLGEIAVRVWNGISKAPREKRGVPIFRISAVRPMLLDTTDVRFLPGTLVDYQGYEVESGDLLFTRYNGNPALVGACAVIPPGLSGIMHPDKLIRVQIRDLSPTFICAAACTGESREHINSRTRSTAGQAGISGANLKLMPLPVAPLPEQHRIVHAIESYFSRLDDAVATLERVQRNLKRYRASVLKSAVEGRLVPTEAELARAEGRDYEPATVLLERIVVERRRRWEEAELAKLKEQARDTSNGRWRNRYSEAQAPEDANSGVPEGWSWASLDQLTHYTIDYRGKTPKSSESGIPIISAANVKAGKLVFDKPRFISEETYRKHAVRGFPEPGDLIVTTEAPVGETALYPDHGTYQLTRRVIGFQTSEIENRYLSYAFASGHVHDHLKRHNRGTTVPRILKPALLRTPIPLPPLSEQTRIVVEVERLLSVADAIETRLHIQEKRNRRLRQAILKWAFEGKLADQDPNDEPASVLLERIRAEREAIAPKKKTTQRGQRVGCARKDV